MDFLAIPVAKAVCCGPTKMNAELHTPTIGSPSLDILHVATALALGATEFCTFDTRQGKLARLAGLRVQP